MEFALLFVIAFLIACAIYRFNKSWVLAMLIPMVLFVLTTLLDQGAKQAWGMTFVFGLPIVAFASLLGAYVIQIRNDDEAP